MVEDDLVVGRAAGRGEDGGEDRHRQQRRPKQFRLCPRDNSAEERVFHFHNLVLLFTG